MTQNTTLCDTCIYERNSCGSGKQRYGPRDTILECDTYAPDGSQGQTEEPKVEVKLGPLSLTHVHIKGIEEKPEVGNCAVCGDPQIVIKVNSRVRSIVCKNHKCNLYYERIKTYSLPRSASPAPPVISHKHIYKGRDNHCIVPGCNHIRIRRNKGKENKGADNS